jgi:hypothetical protein
VPSTYRVRRSDVAGTHGYPTVVSSSPPARVCIVAEVVLLDLGDQLLRAHLCTHSLQHACYVAKWHCVSQRGAFEQGPCPNGGHFAARQHWHATAQISQTGPTRCCAGPRSFGCMNARTNTHVHAHTSWHEPVGRARVHARSFVTQGNLDRHFGADEHIPDSDLANLGGEVADHQGRVSPPRDTARQTVVAISGRCLRVGLWGQLGHPCVRTSR